VCDNHNFALYIVDAHRALELLEDYHQRLSKAQDKPLKNAIERVIRIFKSRLFQALLGRWTIITSGDYCSQFYYPNLMIDILEYFLDIL